MPPVKIKNVLTTETTDTKIQKRPRTKTCRTKNENSSSTLLEELASEAVSSSQVEPKFSQKDLEILHEVVVEYEGQEKNEHDDDRKDKNEVDNDVEKEEEKYEVDDEERREEEK
uniref:Uncharacterized protein n=1 Tax=Solanum tuberosum TaxID=4113 RepID=M1DF85_SOLTU